MKTILIAGLLLIPCTAVRAQVGMNDWKLADPSSAPPPTKVVMPGVPTVYIGPMNGFEIYLAAALKKKHVNLVQVGDPDKAQYIISGNSDETKPEWARWLMTGNSHTDDAATIQMMDRKSTTVIFAYAVNKKYTLHGQQTAAEACAKHLEATMEGIE
jgi:hypothetical protein